VDGHDLLAQLTSQLWAVLAGTLRSDDPFGLVSLKPDASVAGTPLAGRLLDPLAAVPPVPELAVPDLLRRTLGDLTGGPVRLHGWQTADGARRGLALVASSGMNRLVAAVSPSDLLEVAVYAGDAASPIALDVTTGATWQVRLQVTTAAGWEIAVRRGGQVTPRVPLVKGSLKLTATTAAAVTLGPVVAAAGAAAVAQVDAAAPGAITTDVTLRGVSAAFAPPPLDRMLGDVRTSAAEVSLRADAAGGLRATGGGVSVALPAPPALPAASVRHPTLGLEADGAGLRLVVRAGVAIQPAGPIVEAAADALGFDIPLSLGPGAIGAEAPVAHLPDTFGGRLDLPPARGGGTVRLTPDGGFGGVFGVDLGMFAVDAVVQLQPGGRPGSGAPSFLALLAARFTPGLQLGLGFALGGVGGLVGVNHRADADALLDLVRSGHVDRVLFPDDATGQAVEILDTLRRVFPPAAGRFVLAPMLRITWGGRLVQLDVALLLELPDPVRMTILGRMLVAVPDPLVPLLRLQASVLGRIDPGVPEVSVLVSLTGSSLVGIPITGDVFVLVRGGDEAEFVVSAGGFHPRFQRPRGVPDLRRLCIDLSPGGGWGMRADGYLAVTSNSVQFGAHIQLGASIAGCGVEGWLGLDALFLLSPRFGFSVRVTAGVAVRAFGRRLAGISLDFTLEGPAPWHAFGTGSISVLFWDVSLDFDVRWGEPAELPPVTADILGPLTTALRERSAWTVEPPATTRTGLILTTDARTALATGALMSPDAALVVRQTVVPLGTTITRFHRAPLTPQAWNVTSAGVRTAGAHVDGTTTRDQFVPGEFFDLSEDDKLSRPAVQDFENGRRITTDLTDVGDVHHAPVGYETQYRPDRNLRHHLSLLPNAVLEAFAALPGPEERVRRWRTAPQVTVLAAAPTLAGTATTGGAAPGVAAGGAGLVAAAEPPAWLAAVDPTHRDRLERWELDA
jgi:hypothetical protein